MSSKHILLHFHRLSFPPSYKQQVIPWKFMGIEELAYTSELVTWAVKEIESFAFLQKRHVLAQSAAARRLRVATKCIHICLGHCSLSEARGLSLATILLRLFRSIIEQALSANLKKNEESSAALAAADDWFLTYPRAGGSPFSRTASLGSEWYHSQSFQAVLTNSIPRTFSSERLQLDCPALQVFNSYVNLLIRALFISAENEESLEGSGSRIVKMVGTESQQLALLASALLLEDELLPCSAMKLLPFPTRIDEQPKRASEGNPVFQNKGNGRRSFNAQLITYEIASADSMLLISSSQKMLTLISMHTFTQVWMAAQRILNGSHLQFSMQFD
ncbi:hypothetical protein NC651_016676 [Populus alba x Populus x berolinensis]|nr:hypothetical protein NC651_016676 [Populus alba x Populus x berolinensis]